MIKQCLFNLQSFMNSSVPSQPWPVSDGRDNPVVRDDFVGDIRKNRELGDNMFDQFRSSPSFNLFNPQPPTNAQSFLTGGEIGKMLGNAAVSSMQGFVGMGVNALGSLVSSGLNFATEGRKLALGESQLALQNRAFDFEKATTNREWDAAQAAGLFSPSQFGSIQTGAGQSFTFSRGTGAARNVAQRTRPSSAFALTI